MIQNKIKKIILQTIISHYQHQPYNNLSPWNNFKAILNLYKNPLNFDWILFPKFSLSCERMDDKEVQHTEADIHISPTKLNFTSPASNLMRD